MKNQEGKSQCQGRKRRRVGAEICLGRDEVGNAKLFLLSGDAN